MGCIKLCGGVHTAQKQRPIQIPVGFSANLSVSVSVSVSGNVNASIVQHCQREKLEVSTSRCRASLADVNFARAHCRCSVVGKKQLVCVDSRSSTLQTLSLKEAKSFKATLLQVKVNLHWPEANTKVS